MFVVPYYVNRKVAFPIQCVIAYTKTMTRDGLSLKTERTVR